MNILAFAAFSLDIILTISIGISNSENVQNLSADENPGNILSNPGFEVFSDQAGNYHGLQYFQFPHDWNSGSEFFFKYRSLGLIAFTDRKKDGQGFVYSGKRSLMLKGRRILAQNNQDVYVFTLIGIKSGRSYIFSAWIKADDVDENGVCMRYAPIAKDGKTWISGYLNGQQLVNGGTHDWRKYQTLISKDSIPPETEYLIFFLRLKSFAGYALFDDVELIPVNRE